VVPSWLVGQIFRTESPGAVRPDRRWRGRFTGTGLQEAASAQHRVNGGQVYLQEHTRDNINDVWHV
jgi:hypothetical protein